MVCECVLKELIERWAGRVVSGFSGLVAAGAVEEGTV